MKDLRNAYRRYALAFATSSAAICIGFAMQTSEAAILVEEEAEAPRSGRTPLRLPQDMNVPVLGGVSTLPIMPKERGHGASLPSRPVLVAVADDKPGGFLPAEEHTPRLGCTVSLQTETTAGALVALTALAPCHGGELALIEHAGLRFHVETPQDGSLQLMVPALSETANFSVSYPNGDGAFASAEVESLPFYDRVVLQWQGARGPELHAREFGADYGELGHVWREAPRDLSALAGGAGGFLMRFEAVGMLSAAQAEVYTFPTGLANARGDIAISIETEVTQGNCGQDMALSSMTLHQGNLHAPRELRMQMPDCDAVGEFLLLKNLVEDLTIAQK
ncbi:translocase [Shimia sp. R11_0]|uniref:translocase n=1 Tax=Shimia sp. R11_0 TaxID=2821096 RepID=UPI001ADB45B8|nr:translocase [Shimia sp. R11_0]MBO9476064.1 translocase [Shimia sp. R11_0]